MNKMRKKSRLGSDYMTIKRGDFRKNGGKWTRSGQEKKNKPYCLKGHGKENNHLNRAIREALPSGADAI